MIRIKNATLSKQQIEAINTLTLGEYLFGTTTLIEAQRLLRIEQSLAGTSMHKRVTFVASSSQVRDRVNRILEQYGQKTIQPHCRIETPHCVV